MPAVLFMDLIQLPTEKDESTVLSIWEGHGEAIVGNLEFWLGSGSTVYIGWYIDEEHRGKGYATSAVQQILPHLFIHFHRVVALVSTRNGASSNVARRAGMRLEGISKEARWSVRDQLWEDIEVWAALESDLVTGFGVGNRVQVNF